jgi:glycosyltransferase involved in cell wall biosynthesis
MRKSLSCSVSYGSGGLGRHFAEMVEETRSAGKLHHYYTPSIKPNDPHGQVVAVRFGSIIPKTPIRYSPGWLCHLSGVLFDRAVAAHLTPCDEFESLGGQALHSFRQAQKLGCQFLHLQAANSHVDNVQRQHQKALRQYPIESSWLNEAQRQRTLKEYALADLIYVASEYTQNTLLAAGIPATKIRHRHFQVHPRYQPAPDRVQDGVFRVIYIGSLTVMKGIPVLLEAFHRLADRNAELILVGGWSTRGMRKYLQSWLAKDDRIRLAPGDPLPLLQQADVCVHPSYEDGFAYAPMEALACGVPVIVTEDTGMKEYVQDGCNGYVIPTGDWSALLDRLQALQKKPLFGQPIMI